MQTETPGRRKLVKLEELREIMASHHVIEGTRLHVLELLMFGFAFSSYTLLLKSRRTLDRLADEKIRTEISERPYRFGKRLEFGRDLELDRDGTVYYVGQVAPKDVLQEA